MDNKIQKYSNLSQDKIGPQPPIYRQFRNPEQWQLQHSDISISYNSTLNYS